MIANRLSWSGQTKRLAVVILMLVAAGASIVVASRADDDDLISPQAFLTIDLSPSGAGANIQVGGAAAGDHLSGGGPANVFTDLKRSHALATGDFNADGIQDVVIGSADADPATRVDAGAAYIIFGKTTPFLPAIDTSTANANIRIHGALAGDQVGFAVAMGDVNGDTFDDVVIGAPGVDFPGVAATPRATPIPNTGAVYVILGSAPQTDRVIDLATANTADVVIYGIADGDLFGNSVAVGNAGGPAAAPAAEQAIRDILVGAPGSEGPAAPRLDGGAAFLVYGRATLAKVGTATLVVDIGNATTPANVQVFGIAGDVLGNAVAIADLDATAPGDLVVGAPVSDRPVLGATIVPAGNNTGATYIFFGGTNLNPATGTSKTFDISLAAVNQRPSVTIYGKDDDDHLGAALAVGDVSGDNISDLVIGAPDGDGPPSGARTDSGEAYIIQGSTELTPPVSQFERRIDIFSPGAFLRLTVFGTAAGDRAGSAVATGSFNVTGNIDNVRDLIIGSPGALALKGSVSVLFGGQGLGLLAARDLALGQDDVRVLGQVVGDELGWALATADLDQNRGGDLILGAPYADPVVVTERTNAGKVYIILAANDVVPPPNVPPTVTVTAPNGAESLQGGTNFDITWTAADPNGDGTIQRFELRLSTDAGGTFNTIIADNVAGTARTFPWSVPRINSTTARIRVIAFDTGGLQGQDDSNANFTIVDPGIPVHVLTPNGGEMLKFGQTFQISWEVPPASATQVLGFDILLSTNSGATFPVTIAFNGVTPALGAGVRTFDWSVPSTICTQTARVLVQAKSLLGSTSFDTSDANFSITGPGPTVDVNDMSIGDNVLKLMTLQPPVGDQVRFADDVILEISNDTAGTAFSQFRKLKKKKSNRRLISKGTIGDQELETFFPNGATRIMRITNPPCGVTQLRVTRQGDMLVVAVTE